MWGAELYGLSHAVLARTALHFLQAMTFEMIMCMSMLSFEISQSILKNLAILPILVLLPQTSSWRSYNVLTWYAAQSCQELQPRWHKWLTFWVKTAIENRLNSMFWKGSRAGMTLWPNKDSDSQSWVSFASCFPFFNDKSWTLSVWKWECIQKGHEGKAVAISEVLKKHSC